MRFKADESSLAITGPYKLKHPDDNNEAQPVHEHVSVALRKHREAVSSMQKAVCGKQEAAGRKHPKVFKLRERDGLRSTGDCREPALKHVCVDLL